MNDDDDDTFFLTVPVVRLSRIRVPAHVVAQSSVSSFRTSKVLNESTEESKYMAN